MDKIAVSCPTEDEWNKVQEKAFSEGFGWLAQGKVIQDDWSTYRKDTCLDFNNERLYYCNKDYCLIRNYTILSASDYLAYGLEGRGFEVGDEVEVIDGEGDRAWSFDIGDKGEVVEVYKDKSCLISIHPLIKSERIDPQDLKLIESEDRTAPLHPLEHTVPLRVDDRVRVKELTHKGRDNQEGVLINGYKGNFDCLVLFPDGYREPYSKKDLELIPTEADITVGSVWERVQGRNNLIGETVTVIDFDSVGDPMMSNDYGYIKSFLLKDFKLIHRGDGESEWKKGAKYDFPVEPTELTIKPNKKEKKMKTKVISVGLEVIDSVCDNVGKVAYYNEDTGRVAYEEANGSLTVGHIDNMNVSPVKVVMPKPKPVKKKTKKTTKKGK